MDAIRSSFEYAFGKAMGQAAGGLIVWTTVLVFLTVFLLVLYLFNRNKIGFQIKVAPADEPDVAPLPASRPAAPSPSRVPSRELPRLHGSHADSAAGRKEFLRTLDSVERVVATIYMGLLAIVFVAATAAMAWICLEYPDDGNRDFMLFYGGAIYLVGVATLATQVIGTRRRLSGRAEPGLLDQLRSKIQFTVQSSPDVRFVDAAALERARRHMAAGGTLDEACALIDPRYRQMSGWKQSVFCKAVEMALAGGS
jgi:hypothetical protein